MEDKTNICFTRPGGLESIHCLSDGWLRSVPMNKLLHSNYRKTLEMLLTLSQSSPLEALMMIFTKSSAESFHLCVTNVKFMEKSWRKKGRGGGEFLVYFTPNPWRLRWQRIYLQCRWSLFRSLGWNLPWRRKWQSTPVFLPGESQG